jgi:S1-C subfamily serine protease
MKHWICAGCLLVTIVGTGLGTAPKTPAREVFGIRIGMNEDAVRRQLQKVATQQKEEKEEEGEGEQEVWILKKDPRFDYLVVRFDARHELWLVTVVARKDTVRYSEIGDLGNAKTASDGRNFTYKWTIAAKGKQPGYVVLARGTNPDTLTSYAISRVIPTVSF